MNLRLKAILSILPLALLCGVVAVKLTHRAVSGALINEAGRKSISAMADLLPALQKGAAGGSEKLLLPYLQNMMRQDEVICAAVAGSGGTFIAHSNVAQTGGKITEPVIFKSAATGEPVYERADGGAEPALDLAIPIFEQSQASTGGEDFLLTGGSAGPRKRLGTLYLRLRIARYLALDKLIFEGVIWVIISVLLGAFAALFFLLELALKPVKLLTAATERVGRGEYGVTVRVSSDDEIGRLSRSFNRMSEGLKETTVSRDYLNGLLRNIPNAIIVTDADAVITMVNPAGAALLGRDAGDLAGRRICEIFSAECGAERAAIARALQGESIEGRETVIRNKGGGEIQVLLSINRITGMDGRIGLVAAVQDITERKKMEAVMRQSEKMSAVGVLAAGVAHEINNPLGIILGFSQAVRKKMRADDPFAMPVEAIEREALRCKSLVQNMLTFSRASGRDQREEIDLNSAVDGAMSLVAAQAKARFIEVVSETGAGLPRILANRNQVQQVVINLAGNAIDAMPAGGVLTIRTFRSELHPGTITLQIKDTGQGIPENIRGRIFEPFFSTKEVGKGTGLGLSIVYEIVQKHGGQIEVESEAGKGAVLTVIFPAADARPPAEPA